MKNAWPRGVLVLALGSAAVGCANDVFVFKADGSVGTLDGGFEASANGGDDAGMAFKDSGAGVVLDGSPTPRTDASPGSRCPQSLGAPLVFVTDGTSQLCVDATETTNAQYSQFLSMQQPGVMLAPCAGKTSHVPSTGAPPSNSIPVTGVDWCDASAFCKWAGKHLCGRLPGGANAGLANLNNPTGDEWFFACAHGGARMIYPYGMQSMAGYCNTGVAGGGPGAAVDVMSRPMCQGGFPGLFDMSGNVWEWQNECTADVSLTDSCSVRGGSFRTSLENDLECVGHVEWPRSKSADDVGFRCCANPN